MKKALIIMFAALGLTAAYGITGVPDGFTPLRYISSMDSAGTWNKGNIGPYLQIYNADNSPFVLGADDIVETKFQINEKDQGACVFCVRGSSSGKFVLMRAGNSPYKARFDYGTTNNELGQDKINLNNTDVHTVLASKSGIAIDGTTIAPTESTYEPTSNALLLFCCDNGGNGIANAGNKGTIKMYYFRVKDGSGNIRLDLVPMLRTTDSKPGLYDAVSGQFFTNKSANGEFTYGSATLLDRIAAATAFSGATDPAAEGGDYIFKDGYDYIHVFSSVGEGKFFMVTQDRTAQILVVGGGAGGSTGNGGSGGSAGELKTESAIELASDTYTIAVGAGGVGNTDPGSDGTASSIKGGIITITAEGGKGQSKTDPAGDGGDGAGGSGGKHSGYAGGNGGAALASEILGWTEAFAGGGGGGGQHMTTDSTAGGSVEIGGTSVMVGGRGYKGNKNGDAGVAGTGSGGGGGGQNYINGGTGGSGIVIVRLSKTNVEISGEITMPDWTEGETASEPTGLTVTPAEAESEFAYKYYANAACTEAIDKPSTIGVYYVRGEVAESDSWNPAVSAAVEFKILPAGGGKEFVTAPTVTTEFTYTGVECVPVAEGEYYTLSGDTAKTLAGDYTVTLTLNNADKYMWSDTLDSKPKVINWTITQAVNKWMVEPGIDKTVWKSEEDPGVVTPPNAQFGNDKIKAQITQKISGEYADWKDWDGVTMPTEKGKYKIRWQVAELVRGYTALEASIEFLVDYRYDPTAPFMVSTDGEKTWVGKMTIDDACKLIPNNAGTVEVCKDVSISSLSSQFSYKKVTIRSNVDEDEPHAITLTQEANFEISNNGMLILTNIVFNLSRSAKVAHLFSLGENNNMSAALEIQEGTVISGETTGSLINNKSNYVTISVTGGQIKDLTCGGTILPASTQGAFSVRGLTIENCTANELIGIGNKTNNLSKVTIINNTTRAGAITVGTEGLIRVCGDVIVKGNMTQDAEEKNIVLKNAANLEMTAALGENAAIGVSFGKEVGDIFGSFTMAEATKADKETAAKFFWDAKPAKFVGRVDANNKLYWYSGMGLMMLVK